MNSASSALLCDLYQLTMLQGYWQHGLTAPAAFEFFVRKLPPTRNFLVAAGLEQALEFLETLAFTAEELAWLRKTGRFQPAFLHWLGKLRFTGDVDAMPEGTVFFPPEPILRVVAPLPEAQFVESRLINLLHFQTLIASKAARCVLTAPDRILVDFGLRRAHGFEAGLLAARASYLAGFSGTATTLAGLRWAIPISGTMAHSFIQAHDSEEAAFRAFAEANPDGVVLLLDTYDTEAAARKVVALAPELCSRGISVQGVRLDSGDLAAQACRVRQILDNGSLREVRIFASGNLDEFALRDLLAAGAPIDGFGVGTRLDTSADAPGLDCAYKLQEYAGRPRRKRSEGKATWPGRKQVFRRYNGAGCFADDTLALEEEPASGEPLLAPMMRAGRRLGSPEALDAIRQRSASQLGRLPAGLRALEPSAPYQVSISESLQALASAVDQQAC